jgi:hypothetical protein
MVCGSLVRGVLEADSPFNGEVSVGRCPRRMAAVALIAMTM